MNDLVPFTAASSGRARVTMSDVIKRPPHLCELPDDVRRRPCLTAEAAVYLPLPTPCSVHTGLSHRAGCFSTGLPWT